MQTITNISTCFTNSSDNAIARDITTWDITTWDITTWPA